VAAGTGHVPSWRRAPVAAARAPRVRARAGCAERRLSTAVIRRPALYVPTFLNMIYPASVSIANRFDTFAHFDALAEIDDAGLRMRY
jgi:hypothetical protein